MKTATITWISYNNYGTMLQAYALQTYIKKLGCKNDIISDFKIIYPDIENNNTITYDDSCDNDLKKETTTEKKKRRFKKLLSNPLRYLIHIVKVVIKSIRNIIKKKKHQKIQKKKSGYYGSQNLFNEFKVYCLDIKDGYSKKNLDLLNDEYDVFICGSDQIWSVFECDFKGYYYLDFTNKKKISYASSIGTTNIQKNKLDLISKYLSDFKCISVREKASAEQLKQLTNRKVEWVCDPTLLYDGDFWSEFCNNVKIARKKYLLCYFLEDKDWYYKYAKELARHLRLKLLIIPSRIEFMEKKGVYNYPVGPKEFVALFEHANFVLTDSYHGSIFSFIFRKEIIYLKRFNDNDEYNQNIRIESLFGLLNLKNIIISKKSFDKDDIVKINYDNIQNILFEFRKKSRLFLERGLNE